MKKTEKKKQSHINRHNIGLYEMLAMGNAKKIQKL